MSGVLCAIAGIGGGVGAIILNGGTVNSSGNGVRTATFRVANDGYVYFVDNGAATLQYQWEQTTNAPGDYDAYVTSAAGITSGTTGAWVNLSTTRDWSVSSTITGVDRSDAITIQIRNTATGLVSATATVYLNADRTS